MLKKLRKDIDSIDLEIIKLLGKREKLVMKIREYKKKNNLKIVDSEREKEIFDKIYKQARKLGLERKYIKKMFKLIISHSRKIQNDRYN